MISARIVNKGMALLQQCNTFESRFWNFIKAKLKSDLYRVCLDMTILSKTMSSIRCKVKTFLKVSSLELMGICIRMDYKVYET